jgi:hypothetical protein
MYFKLERVKYISIATKPLDKAFLRWKLTLLFKIDLLNL